MIFEPLWQSAQKGELLLVDGGMCHFHLRKDGQVTIREIIVLPEMQGKGVGRQMLETIIQTCVPLGATSVYAKCPADLAANSWYARMGFTLEEVEEKTRSLNCWRRALTQKDGLLL